MQEQQFKHWLKEYTSLQEGPRMDAVSRCKRVIDGLSVSLDEEWKKDKCRTLVAQLEYSYDDMQQNRPLPGRISITGNYVRVMSCLRSAVHKYCEFKEQTATKN